MTAYDRRFRQLRLMVDQRLRSLIRGDEPRDLFDGCRYVLSGGGKRIRSIVLMLSCEAVGGTARQSLEAGTAIEIMHNFTLVHDDIMDHATARRGRPTVHTRWDINNALLVGDVLLGVAYRSLMRTRGANISLLVELFTAGLLDVCEGQALDLAFEHRTDVSIRQYYRMIEKKTGRLIAVAAELGGVIGGGNRRELAALHQFGLYLGRAFQIQDDLLDVIADEKDFGKIVGGDILEGKRTFLLLRAAERARGGDRKILDRVMKRRPVPQPERQQLVADVTTIYRRCGVLDEGEEEVTRNTQRAIAALETLKQRDSTQMLRWLADRLMNRVS